jgi:uroporphyrinogen III methyltransferase/synthase
MSALAGKRVLVTRADEQAGALCSALESAGAVPLRSPTIRFVPPASLAQVDAALARLAEYDWVVFTSANGVRALCARLAHLGAPRAALASRRVAAVGRVTAAALGPLGLGAAFVPAVESASALASSLPDVEGRAVLLAVGEKADPAHADVLRRRGARRVDLVTAYRTLPIPPSARGVQELRKGIDALTFTSPSTVAGFVSLGPEWRSLVGDAIVACLGPATSAAARARGLEVHAEARERSVSALVDALAHAFVRRGILREDPWR